MGLAIASILALSPAALAQAANDDDDAIEKKLSPFIHCINESDLVLQETFGNYRRIVDDVKKDPNTSNIHFSNGFEDENSRLGKSLKCADDLDQAVKASPKIEDLDRMAADYAAAIRALALLAVEADDYFRQQDYKDDKWPKGRQLDEKLGPLIAKLEEASEGFHAGIKRELSAIRERELAALAAKEGKNLRWQAANFMLAARAVLQRYRRESDGGGNRLSARARAEGL